MVTNTNANVKSRIAICLLLNKLSENYQYGQKVGVLDESYYAKSFITRQKHKKNDIIITCEKKM